MGIYALIKRNRLRFTEEMRDSPDLYLYSPSTYSRYVAAHGCIDRHVSGKVLDVGCGNMSFPSAVLARADEYDGLDIERRVPGVKYVADVQDMHMIAPETYDTVLCLEVLEHTPEPSQGLSEIFRVLKPRGVLIVTVPHLARLHEEPNDFYRYTKYGLQFLLESAGFEVMEITPRAGVVSLIGHQFSTVTLGLSWHIPLINRLVFALNRWLWVRPCLWLDSVLDRNGLLALRYAAVARKP